jgi:hypothetical protein
LLRHVFVGIKTQSAAVNKFAALLFLDFNALYNNLNIGEEYRATKKGQLASYSNTTLNLLQY